MQPHNLTSYQQSAPARLTQEHKITVRGKMQANTPTPSSICVAVSHYLFFALSQHQQDLHKSI
ncbi:hypothetical protein E2C01_036216 [Portunus trituberculatus]|uniref:Uncharacterized protein n=1 Tax=Portunus trituberculatus TaxID=210409 RepID=A0A5B7FBV6_PORTR|nr:hypothetical protein [Portunus trituberculatus]